MNPKIAKFLLRLYPASWRQRYDGEFQAFLECSPGSLRVCLNVVWSAICEWVSPTFEPAANQSTRFSQLRSWCTLAPWAVFGIGPPLVLTALYCVALFMLWLGWQLFLPASDSPFGHPNPGPIYGVPNLYFQADRFFYYTAPVLVGWVVSFVTARQRIRTVWPTIGLVLIALIASTNRVHASRSAVPYGLGHISMDFSSVASTQAFYERLPYAFLLLAITALPYLVLHSCKSRSRFG